jgi:hypothetical protein
MNKGPAAAGPSRVGKESFARNSSARENHEMTEIITGGCLCGSVSGNVSSRGFCPTWGSPIVFKTSGLADFVFLTAGSLDDPSLFEPDMVVFTDSAQGWDHIDPSLRRFPRIPKI